MAHCRWVFGNFGVWSEIDASPSTTSPGPGLASQNTNGGVELSQAELRYVNGNSNIFYSLRTGMMNNEGFGASDQWIDDGNIPLLDTSPAQFNQSTLGLPFGAMENPQLGAEFQMNYFDTHLTLGMYNGWDGTKYDNNNSGVLNAALMNQQGQTSRDYKFQLDQFVLGDSAITAAYYRGHIPLLQPGSTTGTWVNDFDAWRLYLTYQAVPAKLELMAGGAYGTSDWLDPNTGTKGGRFHNEGTFLGGNYYALPHLTLSPRVDFYDYNTEASPIKARATALVLMASIPMDNNLFVFHFNHTDSDLSGMTNDFRAEWRFIF